MTPTFGFPDGVVKGSGGADLLLTGAVNVNVTQSFDITSLVSPAHVALFVCWVSALASTGQAVLVQVNDSANSVSMVQPTAIGDGETQVYPFCGALITSIPGSICTVVAAPLTGDPTPLLGTLLVLGLNADTIINPAQRWDLIGKGKVTGNVVCGAGATTTVLAAPKGGFYHRLKTLSWLTAAAPAANAAVNWLDGGGNNMQNGLVLNGVLRDSVSNMDLEWDQSVRLQNTSSVIVNAAIAYERWPI